MEEFVVDENGSKFWYLHGEFLGWDEYGFWALWVLLNDEQRKNSNLLRHTPSSES